MSCAACSARVERAVGSLQGVEGCSVNLLSGVMAVDGDVSSEEIISAVVAAGYGAKEQTENDKNVNNTLQNNSKRIAIRLISSLVILCVLMYITMGHIMLGAPLPSFLSDNSRWLCVIELLLSLSVLIINRAFFIRGVKGAIKGAPNMDTLVALGSMASFIYSTVITVKILLLPSGAEAHGLLHGLYFESAAMILTLVTIGKLLEERAKGKTTDAVRSLMDLAPKLATVERGGELITISADDVLVGDIFVVKPGESIPADGVVIEGESSVAEATLTGEAVPSEKTKGSLVYAATVNQQGCMKCKCTVASDDTAIARVIRLVEDASATKAPIARLADKVSGIFVPIVLALSLVTLAVWLILGESVGYALGRAISVLVISCPCALGLATPVAITVGAGVGARLGILYKSAEAIELAGRAKIIALDKTGTVTEGKPAVTDVVCYSGNKDELLDLALSLEKKSEHPLARAVVEYAEGLGKAALPCEEFSAMAGSGVYGLVNEAEAFGASFGYASEHLKLTSEQIADFNKLSGEGKTPLFFAKAGKLLGIIAAADKLREDSREAIAELSELSMRVVMITGDNKYCAEAIAREAGIGEFHAEMMPDGKASLIKALSSDSGVIMVGDGINDAPSLALADVGAAIGGGADVAIEAADLVLMRDRLSDVPRAVRLGRAVLKNIRENLFWAFIYNVIGIPLAAGVFARLLGWEMSPMLGALAMSLSSLAVVMNALRLNFFSQREKKKENIKYSCSENAKECGKNIERYDNMKIEIKVVGMMCPHCEARVKAAIEAIEGVSRAEVSHISGEAIVTASADLTDAILAAINAAGYECSAG